MPLAEIEVQKPFIIQSLERVVGQGFSDYSVDGVMALLSMGALQAWRRDDCLVVTQVLTTQDSRIVCLAYGSGDLSTIKEMVKDIEDRANMARMHEIRILGRRGWLKELDGYEESYTVLKKRLWAMS